MKMIHVGISSMDVEEVLRDLIADFMVTKGIVVKDNWHCASVPSSTKIDNRAIALGYLRTNSVICFTRILAGTMNTKKVFPEAQESSAFLSPSYEYDIFHNPIPSVSYHKYLCQGRDCQARTKLIKVG